MIHNLIQKMNLAIKDAIIFDQVININSNLKCLVDRNYRSSNEIWHISIKNLHIIKHLIELSDLKVKMENNILRTY